MAGSLVVWSDGETWGVVQSIRDQCEHEPKMIGSKTEFRWDSIPLSMWLFVEGTGLQGDHFFCLFLPKQIETGSREGSVSSILAGVCFFPLRPRTLRQGHFRNGTFDGAGQRSWADGTTYEGQWRAGGAWSVSWRGPEEPTL